MKSKTIYHCEYCDRSFNAKPSCEKHEVLCLQRKIETEKLQGMFLTLVKHFEKKGYTIAIRYHSRDSDDFLISVK